MNRIPGPAGSLEAGYVAAPEPAGAQAVLCHPHPQYGGSMHDAVLNIVADVLLDAGIGVLRFNFRGVGASDGHYDDGRGEVDDLLAAARWLRSEFPEDALWAGGYSFGAWVVWQALDRGLDAGRILLVAPPAGAMTFAPRAPGIPAHAIAGDADAFVDLAALQRLPDLRCQVVAGADHFFSGRGAELAAAVRGLLPRRSQDR